MNNLTFEIPVKKTKAMYLIAKALRFLNEDFHSDKVEDAKYYSINRGIETVQENNTVSLTLSILQFSQPSGKQYLGNRELKIKIEGNKGVCTLKELVPI